MKTKKLILGTILAIALFISCDPNDNPITGTPSKEDAFTEAKIDVATDDISLIVQNQAQQSLTLKSSTPSPQFLPICATVTDGGSTNDNWIKIVDFGTTGCTLANGNTVKGQITVTFSKTNSTTRTIYYTTENFYHNGNLIVGNKSIVLTWESTAAQSEIHPVITHNIDLTVTLANGKTYTRTGTITKEVIAGYQTSSTWNDNISSVTGSTITTHPDGYKIHNTVITPVLFKASCGVPCPVQGSISIVKNDSDVNKGVIDFGDGTCDRLATLTIRDIIITFEMKK